MRERVNGKLFWTLGIAILVLVASPGFGAELVLDLQIAELPEGALWLLRSPDGEEEVTRPLDPGGFRDLVAGHRGWTLGCRGPGIWCPNLELKGEPTSFPVYPAMEVVGSLAGSGPPDTGQVQGFVNRSGGALWRLGEDLDVQDGKFRIVLPRTVLDLRFSFPGAAPIYYWNLAPPPSTEPESPRLDLGEIVLVPGASMIGWAQRWEDRSPIPGATVTARLGNHGGASHPLLTTKTTTDEDGFFQITSLEAGIWQLEITAQDLAPKLIHEVEIEPGAETPVGTILLTPPLEVAVGVSPPTHPDGSPWNVVLRPSVPLPEESRIVAQLSEEGRGKMTGLRPTEYSIRIEDERGNAFHVVSRMIMGNDQWLFDLALVTVGGRVSLGEEPLEARLKLQTGQGDRVTFTSGEDGVWSGWMRRPQRPWLMATVTWTEGDERRQRNLEVAPDPEDDPLLFNLRLPVGAIHGQVADGAGRPRAEVRVAAIPTDGASRFTTIRTLTDRSGRFHFTGLEAASYGVQAGGNGRPSSEIAEINLADTPLPRSLHLVLQPVRRVSFQVNHGNLPVTGATLVVQTLGRIPDSVQGVTGPEGRLVLDLPRSADRAVLTATAPGLPLWSGCLQVDDAVVDVALPEGPPGRLVLDWRGSLDLPPLTEGHALVWTGDGGFFTHGLLTARRSTQMQRDQTDDRERLILRTPSLAAGRYAASWSADPVWRIAERACSGGYGLQTWTDLPPGGEARLTLDTTRAQERRLEELREESR